MAFLGRDHNPGGFTIWLAGGGVKAGFSFGATDDLGYQSVVDPVSVHDLHATILHLLGFDHLRRRPPRRAGERAIPAPGECEPGHLASRRGLKAG